MMRTALSLLVVLVLMIGCARPVPESRPAIVTFKAKGIRLHDTAFVTKTGREVEVDVYSAGQLVLQISTGSMLCVNGRCLSDDEFTAEYLSPFYPPRVVGSILQKVPLDIDARPEPLESGGFTQQEYREGEYDIRYRVGPDSVLFKDLVNGVIIAVKDLKQ